jgi:SulP family sulfate permease
VIAAVILVVLVLLVAPLGAWLPNAAMAGILFMVAWGLIDLPHIRHIARASGADLAVLAITFTSTLVLDLEFAILLGVLASLVVYLRRTSKPAMSVCVPDPRTPERRMAIDPALPECPQLRIQRLDGSIWFGAVNSIDERWRSQQRRHPLRKHLLLMMQAVNFVDLAGAELLAAEAERRRRPGGGLYLYGLKPGVCEPLTRGGYYQTIGAENTFDSKREALDHIIERLDMEICARCEVRIFLECRRLPGGPDHRPVAAEGGDGGAGPADSRGDDVQ